MKKWESSFGGPNQVLGLGGGVLFKGGYMNTPPSGYWADCLADHLAVPPAECFLLLDKKTKTRDAEKRGQGHSKHAI